MAKPMLHVTQFLRPEWLVVSLVIALLSFKMPVILDALPPRMDPPSPRKPFDTISAFWPQYMREHQDGTNVKLHVTGTSLVILLALAHPELLGAGIVAVQCGCIAFEAFRHFDHGLLEASVMVFVFFTTHKFLRGQFTVALFTIVLGYAFAWTGHFFFENNRPATFIYPTYSFVCDFIMWAETLMGITVQL